jgi:putative ABC transport system permease protein
VSAIWTKARADLGSRRLQTAVIASFAMVVSGLWTVNLTLLANSSSSWDAAFAAQQGSHLRASFDAGLVTPEQLAATPAAIGASASGGPWPVLWSMPFETRSTKLKLTILGRSQPGGQVDALQVVAGRWARAPDEIVLTRSQAKAYGIEPGDRLQLVDRAGHPAFRVSGEVVDLDQPSAQSAPSLQAAWMLPSRVAELDAPFAPALVMGYRFPGAPGVAELGRASDRLRAAVPAGALGGTSSYLITRTVDNAPTSFVVEFLVGFSIFGLVVTVAIVANSVAGAVIANYREIGIMKTVGFGPLQVAAVFVLQVEVAAAAGAVAGVAAGALVSRPLLEQSADALGLLAGSPVLPGLDLAVVAAVLLVALTAALPPALRAGSLGAIDAITLGTSPGRGRGSRLARGLDRLGLPRPLSLGAADAFVRPLRGAMTTAGVQLGVSTLAFALGLAGTAVQYANLSPSSHIQVEVDRYAGYPDGKVMAALAAQPDTSAVVGLQDSSAIVAGVPDLVDAVAMRGDPTRIGYRVTDGRWFRAPGEAVVSPSLLRATGRRLGDSLDVTVNGHVFRLRTVGIQLEGINLAHQVRFSWATYTEAEPGAQPALYYVHLRPGSDIAAYVRAVQRTEPDYLGVTAFGLEEVGPIMLLTQITDVVALLLALAAVASVFNNVLLTVRERSRDIAILRAVGLSPGQALAMVSATAAVIGLLGGLLGAPAGMLFHRGMVASVSLVVGNPFPAQIYDVFSPLQLPALVGIGVLLALAGAVLPGRWAARSPIAERLHSE